MVSGSVRVLGNSAASPGDSAGAELRQRNVLNTSTQSVQVNGNGSIVADGFRSHGAAAEMDHASLVSFDILDRASIVTLGEQSHGINALSKTTGAVALGVTANAAVTAFGRESVGARLDAGGQVTVANAGRVTSAGKYGVGIFAQSVTAGAEITIDPSAIVAGGWQSDMTLAPGVLLPSAEVLFNTARNALLFNRGIIGSGADRAIGDLATNTGSVGVTNWGQVTGFVDFNGAGTNAFINASGGSFDVRHFADTNGDGVSDTKRVSVSNFGAPTSSFNNATGATVRLAPDDAKVFNKPKQLPHGGAASWSLRGSSAAHVTWIKAEGILEWSPAYHHHDRVNHQSGLR
ncbi:hypothetical protein [Devosia sp. 2618]|uniref:hypothetical protein n=1 Tax=Devosia sp. 2618 TaxID=3156454 RepID=UPI0033997039